MPLQSLAGVVAVKKAIAELLKKNHHIGMAPGDIIVTHKPNGSPRLALASASLRKTIPQWRSIRISISHTATHAVGIAALSEKAG
jgi:phosphopantetheinyl transferase (holo-ACP synthase)